MLAQAVGRARALISLSLVLVAHSALADHDCGDDYIEPCWYDIDLQCRTVID